MPHDSRFVKASAEFIGYTRLLDVYLNGRDHLIYLYIIGYNHSRKLTIMPKFTTRLRRRQLDESLSKLKEIIRPPRGYIHEIRNALEMSSYQLAERMGVRQSTVMDMEESERNGTITLRSLERAGASLGCRVVYALVPESSLQEMVSLQARNRAQELSETVFRTMALEQQATTEKDRKALIDELTDDVLRKGKEGVVET